VRELSRVKPAEMSDELEKAQAAPKHRNEADLERDGHGLEHGATGSS